MRAVALAVLLVARLAAGVMAASPTEIEITVAGQQVFGRPLAWTSERVLLLGKDGRLWDLDPADAKEPRASQSAFRSLTKNEVRAALQREFGERFEVTSTGNYLVVHPAGTGAQWSERFELLYRSFLHYFQARGFRPDAPYFPLVAVVMPSQQDFLRYAAAQNEKVSPQVLGYYSPLSNRIVMYDSGSQGGDWMQDAETLIHEAAHQTAFNTGVHSRWSMPPRWVAEGLGTMFEARGVYDAPHFTSQSDRINRGRREAFQRYAATRRPKGALAALVASDRAFQSDPDGAYAEAWALTFYLAETQPGKYFSYLSKTASHAPFVEVRGPERLKDFTSVFGDQLDLLEAKMLRFFGELK